MKFLEKNLEDILFNHFSECQNRGLRVGYGTDTYVKYRQLRLDPYGIADIVLFAFDPSVLTMNVLIIECKKDEINLDTYLQARRYETAIRELMEHDQLPVCALRVDRLLIGKTVSKDPDFYHAYEHDSNCLIFTYDYSFYGISFEDHKYTHALPCKLQPDEKFLSGVLDHIDHRMNEYREFMGSLSLRSSEELPLIVTPDGVLVNPNIINGEIIDDLPF